MKSIILTPLLIVCFLPVLQLFEGLFTDPTLRCGSFVSVSFFFLSSVPLPRFLTPALLPELVTNAPPPRLAGHLYFMLNCVITFNPVPFLFSFLSQMRMPVSESARRHVGTRSSVLSSKGRRKAGGGGEEAGVWVDLPLPSFPPPSFRETSASRAIAGKGEGKGNKN